MIVNILPAFVGRARHRLQRVFEDVDTCLPIFLPVLAELALFTHLHVLISMTRFIPASLYLTLLTSFAICLPAVTLNSPYFSHIKDSLALEQSQATYLSLPTYLALFPPGILADNEDYSSNTFLIPNTNLTLRLHQFEPLLDSTDLSAFFREASIDLQNQIDQFSVSATSFERWFYHTSNDGIVLELWTQSFSPHEYVDLAELRHVINGLSLYTMQQRQSRTIQFQVIEDLRATNPVIMNIGSIRRDVATLDTRAKRVVSPARSTQGSSASSVTGGLNTSTLNLLLIDDFPIPDTDYSLRFGNLGSPLYPWDLETLLIAVSAAIEEEIAAHGRIARLPSAEYSKDLAGLQLWILKMPWITDNLAWAELAIIVHGLWLYVVVGGHDREAFVDVFDHVTGSQVALGWIGKPSRSLKATSFTGAARRA